MLLSTVLRQPICCHKRVAALFAHVACTCQVHLHMARDNVTIVILKSALATAEHLGFHLEEDNVMFYTLYVKSFLGVSY